MSLLSRPAPAVLMALLVLAFAAQAPAQTVVYADHNGKMLPVRAVRNSKPLVEEDGQRVTARGSSFGLRQVDDFVPVLVDVSGLTIHTSAVEMADNPGSALNNTFEFSCEFESPQLLENVFLVLQLDTENEGKSLFLREVGTLEPHRSKFVKVTAAIDHGLGEGRYKFHLYTDGFEVLTTRMPPEVREQALAHMIARRIQGVDTAETRLLFGPSPEYPAALADRNVKGNAVIRVTIEATGAVKDAAVLSATEPAFGAAALAAVRQWRFIPRVRHGQPVEAKVNLPFNFDPPAAPPPPQKS